MRTRLLVSLVLSALAATALALPVATGAITIPKGVKTAKVTKYPVTVDTVGYLDYTWTYDSTEPCVPGFAKTIEESLTFEYGRPQVGGVQVTNGKVVLFPVAGGESNMQTELSGWQTTNNCPPYAPAYEPPEPVCKKNLRSKIQLGVMSVKEERGADDPAPLAHPTQVLIYRTKPALQNRDCSEKRPAIEAEGERTKGWMADPRIGIIAPLGLSDVDFWRLGVGKKLKRTITISGGCGKASFKAGAGASAIPPGIRSCVVKGKVVVMIKRTGKGFST